MSAIEEKFWQQITAYKLPVPVREHRFHAKRRWRFDFAWPDLMIAVEIEGGTWSRGQSRHTSGKGYEGDCEKYSTAAIDGWCVIRATSSMVTSGKAINLLILAVSNKIIK